jgi:hypothetical protein
MGILCWPQQDVLQIKVSVISGLPRGGGWMFKPPLPEILKALQNRAKLNLIVNC